MCCSTRSKTSLRRFSRTSRSSTTAVKNSHTVRQTTGSHANGRTLSLPEAQKTVMSVDTLTYCQHCNKHWPVSAEMVRWARQLRWSIGQGVRAVHLEKNGAEQRAADHQARTINRNASSEHHTQTHTHNTAHLFQCNRMESKI